MLENFAKATQPENLENQKFDKLDQKDPLKSQDIKDFPPLDIEQEVSKPTDIKDFPPLEIEKEVFKPMDIKDFPPLEIEKEIFSPMDIKDFPPPLEIKEIFRPMDIKDFPPLEIIKEVFKPIHIHNLPAIGEYGIMYHSPIRLDKGGLLDSLLNRDLTPISDETKARLEEKGWPKEIIDNLTSEEEVAIYEGAGLEPVKIGDKWHLVRTDIDYNQLDDSEPPRTNLERMQAGLAPLDKEGKPLQLHHIGQASDAPLAELTVGEHRTNRDENGRSNDVVLHDKSIESEIDRSSFNKDRKEYWKARAEEIEATRNQTES